MHPHVAVEHMDEVPDRLVERFMTGHGLVAGEDGVRRSPIDEDGELDAEVGKLPLEWSGASAAPVDDAGEPVAGPEKVAGMEVAMCENAVFGRERARVLW